MILILASAISCGAPRFYYHASPDKIETENWSVYFGVFSINDHAETGAKKSDSTFEFDVRVFGKGQSEINNIEIEISDVTLQVSGDTTLISVRDKNAYRVDKENMKCVGRVFGPFVLKHPFSEELTFSFNVEIRDIQTGEIAIDRAVKVNASLNNYKVGTIRDFLRGK